MDEKIIKMNFAQMDEMALAFSEGAKELESVIAEVKSIAKMLEDGGLIGGAGEALANGCRGPLVRAISEMKEWFVELKDDINFNKEAIQSADQKAKGYYQ